MNRPYRNVAPRSPFAVNIQTRLWQPLMKPLRKRRLAIQSLEGRRLLAAVQIPDDLTAAPAEVVSVPVNIDTSAGIRGAEIRLSYDTTMLDLDDDDIELGSVWGSASDTQITANVDDAAGTVVIFVSSSSELADLSGSLVELPFSVDGDAVVNSTFVFDLTQVRLNEGQIAVDPAPVSGDDSTDGLLTIVASATGDDVIRGFVYADADADNVLDPGEAIPGVTITLIHSATGTERQTTTDADGSYEFVDLAPGEYEILQTQPVAYLDSGDNELDVTLVEGTALEDQDFRELGLLPQYIFNRLHTNTVQPPGSDNWSAAITMINTVAEAEADTSQSSTAAAASTSTASSGTTQSSQSESTASGEPLVGLLANEDASSTREEAGEPILIDVQTNAAAVAPSSTHSTNDDEEHAAIDHLFANQLF